MIVAAVLLLVHPRPPVAVPVRVHAGPGRHRAGDDPGPAAGAASPRSTAPSCGSSSARFSIQPGEFAKLALLSFFAYYLVRKREVLSLASKRFLGIDFPRGRDLGPVLVVWLLSLLVLVFEKDLGTSLLYFGMFVVTLYIATERSAG